MFPKLRGKADQNAALTTIDIAEDVIHNTGSLLKAIPFLTVIR